MLYRVVHTTAYQYTVPVALCHNSLHLQPRHCPRQTCHEQRVQVRPDPGVLQTQVDYFGNPVLFFTIQEPHTSLTITAESRLEVHPPEPIALERVPAWEAVRDQLRHDRSPPTLDAYQFVFDSRYVQRHDELSQYAAPSFFPGRPLVEAVLDLTQRIYREFQYDQRATTVSTPIREVLAHRRGVCQDFAHLQIGCLRSLGLAARYVSGYLVTDPPPGQDRLVGADASHAWLSVYCPSIGWIDLDPTNNQIPSDRHLTLAWGRDYDDVSPVRGIVLGGGRHTLNVTVDVTPEPAAAGFDKDRPQGSG
jgi:transglutaminase-like putative cysteine protease